MSKLFDLYKEIFYKEEERRSSINNSLSMPIGIITLLIGANFSICLKIESPKSAIDFLQISFILIAFATLIIGIYFCIRAFWGYTYSRPANAIDLEYYRKNLVNFYEEVNFRGNIKEKSEAESIEYYSIEYAKCAAKNAENNDKKSANLHNSMASVILSIIFTTLGFAPYIIQEINSEEKPQRVIITNIKELKMQNDRKPTPSPPPPPPPKPTPPPSKEIRENQEKPIRK